MNDGNAIFSQIEVIAEAAPCGVGIYDITSAAPVFMNRAFYRMTGYTREEYNAQKIEKGSLVLRDDAGVLEDIARAFARDGEARGFEYRLRGKDGRIRWVKQSVSTVKIGSGDFAFVVFDDITGEKEIAERFQLIAENAGSGIALLRDNRGRLDFVYANEKFYDTFDIGRSCGVEDMHRHMLSAVEQDDFEKLRCAIRDAFSTEQPAEVIYRYRRGGRRLWLKQRFVTVSQSLADGRLLVSVTTDVTAEKEAERKAALEQDRFRTVISELNAVVLEWDAESNSLYCSDAFRNFARGGDGAGNIYIQCPAEVVHPDDIGELEKYNARTKAGEKRVEVTLRLKMNTGEYHWCSMIGFCYRGADGRPTRTIGVIIDVNEERRQTIKLNKLLDEVPAGIGIYDIKDGVASLSNLNEAYYSLLGADPDQRRRFMGVNNIEAVHPDDRGRMQALIARLCAGSDRGSESYRALCGDGTWKYLNLTASVVERGPDSIKVYAAFSDCDEIMRAQRELESNRTMLDAALENARVMEWRYDIKTKVMTDSGALGVKYGYPRVVEGLPDVFMTGRLAGSICRESFDDFRWLFENCGSTPVRRDIKCKSPDGKNEVWQRITFIPVFSEDGQCRECIGVSVDITEQREREQNYEEQLRLRKVAAQDALAMAGYNLTSNRVMESECRSPEFEFAMGLETVDDVLQAIRQHAGSAEETRRFYRVRNCAAMLAEHAGGVTHIEIRHHVKGDSRWMLSTFDMFINPYTGDVEAAAVLRDISEMVRAEMVVNRLLDVDYQFIMTVDAKTGAVKPFKSGDNEEKLREFAELQSGDGWHCAADDGEAAAQGGMLAFVKRQLSKTSVYESLYTKHEDGKTYHKRLVYTYLDDAGDAILCAVQDVTDTYEQEERQKEELARALRTAEDASRSKTEFLARMSHDMRTPMNGILGLAELAEDENDPASLKAHIAQMKQSGVYLLSLINDTLDFQRIESGKMLLNRQVVYTKHVFDSMIAMMLPSMESKGIEFRVVNHNADMDWYVYLDPVRIKQVFMNLMSNAAKFTPAGGSVTMDIRCLAREGMISHNCIRVTDTGIGMSRDFIQNRLFKPFEQEQSAVSAQYAGTGLGLSITRNLLDMMGGRIEVESELGKGTTFIVYLDFERVDSDAAQKLLARDSVERTDAKSRLEGRRILLVEDHPLNAQISQRLLEKAGCKVTWVCNGREALDAFAASRPDSFDAVLMDIRMPVMNGLEAAAAIRALNRPDAAGVPIIAMTANAYDEDVKKSLNAGMNAHLAKPIEKDTMYSVLADLIKG